MSNWKFAAICAFVVLLAFCVRQRSLLIALQERCDLHTRAIFKLVEDQEDLIKATKDSLGNHQKAIEDIAALVPNLKVYKGHKK